VHPSLTTPDNMRILAAIWMGGILCTVLASIGAWRFAPASLADTAQLLDRRLATKNRLEAAAALDNSTSALAHAQREETHGYLQSDPRARPVRALPWLVGGVILLAILHLATMAVWLIPALLRPPAPVPPPAPKELPRASIVWESPEPESKANPVEEVPTAAMAQSSSGLRNLSLEISVNGDPKKSVPLPVKPYDQAGTNEIKVSIYMDELGVQPYDVVAYYLRGQRITEQKVPDTTSAIQFIQVRPFRDDVTEVPPGNKPPPKGYALLIRLKLAELKSIKENFVLAHTDLAVTDPVRVKENDRVGKNQGDLSAKTEEIVQAFIQDGVSADVIDLLRQAEPYMTDASKKILATQNAPALKPQGKALSLIVEVEKFVIKLMGPPTPIKPPDSNNPDDPFKDKQQHQLKKRYQTSAGQLEQLAINQAKLAKDVSQGDSSSSSQDSQPTKPGDSKPNSSPGKDSSSTPGSQPSPSPSPAPSPSAGTNPGDSGPVVPMQPLQSVDPFGPGADKGTLAERQARILQGVEALLSTNKVLPPTVNDALQQAKEHATESLHQLDQSDQPDAREPAAAAALDLQHAIAEMNKSGDEDTKAAMEQAQRELNDLAAKVTTLAKTGTPGGQQADFSKLAGEALDLRKALADAADQQQEAGSSEGAERLAHLANQLGSQNVASDLHDMSKSGLDVNKALAVAQKLEELANEAAQGQIPVKPSAQDIFRLVNALEKSRANLARLMQKAGAPGTPAPGKDGVTPGQKPGQGQGDKPGDQMSQTPGQGKGQGQGQGQGEKPGDQMTKSQQPGEGQGQGQGKDPSQQANGQSGQGQGQGKDSSQQANTQSGQGQGKDPSQANATQPGQGQGQGQGNGTSENTPPQPSNANANFTPPDQSSPTSEQTGGTGTGGTGFGGAEGEYREVLADMKEEMQQASVIVPNNETTDIQKKLTALDDTHFRATDVANVVRAYQEIAAPLDTLILSLRTMAAHAERENVVQLPDLDEATPLYRPAVSDYFEAMSRDYHPADADDTSKKKP
jgi:hypothetical protein